MLTVHTARAFAQEIAGWREKTGISDEDRASAIDLIKRQHEEYETRFDVFVSQCKRPGASDTLKRLARLGWRRYRR